MVHTGVDFKRTAKEDLIVCLEDDMLIVPKEHAERVMFVADTLAKVHMDLLKCFLSGMFMAVATDAKMAINTVDPAQMKFDIGESDEA